MSRPPDILFVVIDSLRADRASCYGYERGTTPNLDRLAAEGCLFERAITAAPFSPASYASLISNLYPHQHGVNGDTVRAWPDGWPRLPELLRERGYTTFCLSNNSFVSREMNAARGFDTFIDLCEPSYWAQLHERIVRRMRMHFGEYVARRLTPNRLYCREKGDSAASMRQAAELLAGADKPVFGLVILMDPHTPYRITRTRFVRDHAAFRRFFRRRNNRIMWGEMTCGRTSMTPAELAVVRDVYDAESHHADECLGELVAARRAAGRLDDTLFIVASDHGEAFGEHGVWGHGFDLSDALTRVPLVMRYPRLFPAGTRVPQLVQLHDVHPTCLLAAAQARADEDGFPNNLAAVAAGRAPGRDAVFSHFPMQTRTLEYLHELNPAFRSERWDGDMWAVRTKDWRYTQFGDGTSALYDLLRDPAETADASAAHPRVAADLAARLAAFRESRPPVEITPAQTETSDALNERLRALGYI